MSGGLFDLSGKSVLVIGASRGIGLRLAEACAEYGAGVTSCGRSKSPLRTSPGIDYRVCDVADMSQVLALTRMAAETSGHIDVLIYAAGTTTPATSGMQPLEDFVKTLEVNLVSAYRCILAAEAWFAPNASVILVSSINARLGFPGNPGYVASKGGMSQLAKALAMDLAERGIRVNTLAPGYVRTQMTEASYADPQKRARRAERTMLGRWGEVDDLVGAAIFLASDASAYVTGHELCVDGGWVSKGI